MEDSLLKTRANGGTVRYQGEFPTEDEELSPTVESIVVSDWLLTLGGAPLQDLVVRVYAKDLETESLADLRDRITDNLESLKAEAAQQSLASTATVSWARSNPPAARGRSSYQPAQRLQWRSPAPQYRQPAPTQPAPTFQPRRLTSPNPRVSYSVPGAPASCALHAIRQQPGHTVWLPVASSMPPGKSLTPLWCSMSRMTQKTLKPPLRMRLPLSRRTRKNICMNIHRNIPMLSIK